MESMCFDAKKKYLQQEEFVSVMKRLAARMGWTMQELEGWLTQLKYKTCKGNRVMGTARAREEAVQVAQGGPRGEQVRAVQAIREDLTKRISGSKRPVVTVMMVQELRDNKSDICGRAMEGVTAAILMAAAQEGMQVEMFEVGGEGQDRGAVAEAHQSAVEAGWIGKKEAVATLKAWQDKGQDRLLQLHQLHKGVTGSGLQQVEGVRGRLLCREGEARVGTRGSGCSDQRVQAGEGEGPSCFLRTNTGTKAGCTRGLGRLDCGAASGAIGYEGACPGSCKQAAVGNCDRGYISGNNTEIIYI